MTSTWRRLTPRLPDEVEEQVLERAAAGVDGVDASARLDDRGHERRDAVVRQRRAR